MRTVALASTVVLILSLVAAGCQGQSQPQDGAKPQPQPERGPAYVPDAGLARILAAGGRKTTPEERAAWLADLGGSKAAAAKLAEHLRRGQPSVEERKLIADLLDACDREDPVPGLLLLVRDTEMGRVFRSGIVHLLSDEHGGAQTVAPLAELLRSDPSPEVRVRVASEMGSMYLDGVARDFKAISEALIGALADKEERVRDLAAWSLGCLAESEPGLLPRLEQLKTHEDPNVRAGAVEALRNVRPKVPGKPGGRPERRGDASGPP
jgi:HEAT repeat protein